MEIGRCPRRAAAVNRRASAGFTLLELLTVVAIIATIAAVSIPALLGAVTHAKVRGASSSLAGLIQSGRMQAIKRNKTLTVQFVRRKDVPFAVVTAAGNVSAATDPQVQLGGSTFQVAVPTGGIPPLSAAILSYTPLNLPDEISFNPRGLPCKYVAGVCNTAGFIYYLTDTGHSSAWTAVSISPGGRVKQWFWNGAAWTD